MTLLQRDLCNVNMIYNISTGVQVVLCNMNCQNNQEILYITLLQRDPCNLNMVYNIGTGRLV
jgi:hypothetical protein